MPVHARLYGAAVEPIAVAPFFAPEAWPVWGDLGLTAEQAYAGARAGPMGRVTAEVVGAVFYTFSPQFTRTAVDWDALSPGIFVETQRRLARDVLTRLLGDDASELQPIVGLLRRAVDAIAPAGRPLAAACAALPWPEEPVTALWHSTTVLREHRGDGHNAVLATHGVDGCEALVLDAAFAEKSDRYVAFRMWQPEEIEAARGRLVARGYLTPDGALSEPGAKFREMMEMETDRMAAGPYHALAEEERDAGLAMLRPLAERVVSGRAVPRFVEKRFAGT